jgi:hypothetical protein
VLIARQLDLPVTEKETKMTTNRIMLVLGAISMLLVTLAVSSPFSNAAPSVDLSWPPRPDYSHLSEKPLVSIPDTDFYQRHPEWTWVSRDAASDYFQRHPELSMSGTGIDLTDYFNRHPELTISVETSADLTDYFFRQQLLPSSPAVDLTDYFFRHP